MTKFFFVFYSVFAWGFEKFMKSCLKKLEHDVAEVSLCHLGRSADPGYREGVNSVALGRA